MNTTGRTVEGTEVHIAPLGRATVIRYDGSHATVALLECNSLQVRFPVERIALPNGTPLALYAAELIEAAPPPSTTSLPSSAEVLEPEPDVATESEPLSDTRVDWKARRAVEALRFGLVPYGALARLTLGYDELANWVSTQLPAGGRQPRPRAAQVTGPFGTGKSHTMAVIRFAARERNYLTARVEVDGQLISLSDPERLLNGLWSSLEGPGFNTDTPVLDLYSIAQRRNLGRPDVRARGVDRVQDSYGTVSVLSRLQLLERHSDSLDQLFSSSDQVTAADVSREIRREFTINAGDVVLHRMIGRRVEERAEDFLEVLLGHAQLAKLAGFEGLVITLDEFEVEDNLSNDRLNRVAELLAVLRRYFSGQSRYPEAPLSIFIATVGEEGHETKALVDNLVSAAGGRTYRLRPWTPEQYRDFARLIHDVYCDAYGIEERFESQRVPRILRRVEEADSDDAAIVRAFIKAYVSDLDARLGPPSI